MTKVAIWLACVLTAAVCVVGVAKSEELNSDSAVLVRIGDGHGSGVYLGSGYVLTAGHVAVHGVAQEITVVHQRAGGWEDTWTATVVWVDAVQDFGLLHINAAPVDLPAAKVNCTPPTLGENVTVVGWPVNLGRIVSRGYIAGGDDKRDPWAHSYIMVGAIFFGNSGGPVYDDKGQVVALAVGILQGTSLAIVIPASAVCSALPAVLK